MQEQAAAADARPRSTRSAPHPTATAASKALPPARIAAKPDRCGQHVALAMRYFAGLGGVGRDTGSGQHEEGEQDLWRRCISSVGFLAVTVARPQFGAAPVVVVGIDDDRQHTSTHCGVSVADAFGAQHGAIS